MRRGFLISAGVLALAAGPAAAQVAVPRSGALSNAQPVFCVNPTTAAVEDCVGSGGGGGSVTQGTSPWVDDIAQVGGGNLTLGQAAKAASLPVTIASDQGATAVTGTFWQATQPVSLAVLPALAVGSNVIGAVTESGTWTVQPGNTANTTPWLATDSSDAAQVSAGTAPGRASVGALIYNSSAPSPSSGQSVALQGDSSGNLDVNLKTALPAGSNAIGSVTLGAGSATIGALTANQSINTAQVGGVTTLAGAGATGTGSQRVTVAQDSTTVGGSASIPAGTNIIGKVDIDQTTPGTTNGTQDASDGATGSSVPSKASYVGANAGGLLTGIVQASASTAINVSSATTTQLVALSSGKSIYVTHFDFISAGTTNVTFEYGTGSSCGTGTTALTGAYNTTAQVGVSAGVGLGPVLVVPSGNALCVVNSAAIQVSGGVSYTQF